MIRLYRQLPMVMVPDPEFGVGDFDLHGKSNFTQIFKEDFREPLPHEDRTAAQNRDEAFQRLCLNIDKALCYGVKRETRNAGQILRYTGGMMEASETGAWDICKFKIACLRELKLSDITYHTANGPRHYQFVTELGLEWRA